jgi:hypothetical protein
MSTNLLIINADRRRFGNPYTKSNGKLPFECSGILDTLVTLQLIKQSYRHGRCLQSTVVLWSHHRTESRWLPTIPRY